MNKNDIAAYSQALLDCSFPRRRICRSKPVSMSRIIQKYVTERFRKNVRDVVTDKRKQQMKNIGIALEYILLAFRFSAELTGNT